MNGTLLSFFPLTLYATKLGLAKSVRDQIVFDIDESSDKSSFVNDMSSWTGDVSGFHEVHNNPVYAPLFAMLKPALVEYNTAAGITPETYDYWYTRSWGVKQTEGRVVDYHRHDDAHLVAVYYPKVPEGAGQFSVATETHQNELFKGMFRAEQYEVGAVSLSNPHSSAEKPLQVEEDYLLVLPAKTAHRTLPNQSSEARYSVTIDILLTLKTAHGFEFGLPPVERWKKG